MNKVHFAIPEIYGETLSYYELLRKLVDKTNELIDNYNTVPEQIAEAVSNLDASQLFSAVLNQLIHSIATDNTKSANAVKVYKKHDLLYAVFNETVNLYESLIDFSTGTETELIPGTNIREVNISELFIELRKLIDINKNNIEAMTAVANENSAAITTMRNDITSIENKNTEQDNEISTLRTMISSPYNFKGDVASISALPASGEVNDTYYVQDVKYKVTWTGSAWVQSSLSEADYQTELGELKGNLELLGNFAEVELTEHNGYLINTDYMIRSNASAYYSVFSFKMKKGKKYKINAVNNQVLRFGASIKEISQTKCVSDGITSEDKSEYVYSNELFDYGFVFGKTQGFDNAVFVVTEFEGELYDKVDTIDSTVKQYITGMWEPVISEEFIPASVILDKECSINIGDKLNITVVVEQGNTENKYITVVFKEGSTTLYKPIDNHKLADGENSVSINLTSNVKADTITVYAQSIDAKITVKKFIEGTISDSIAKINEVIGIKEDSGIIRGNVRTVGKLFKSGAHIVDSNNVPVELRGVGLHQILQYPNLHTWESFNCLKQMGVNMIRCTVYLHDRTYASSDNEPTYGYISHPDETKEEIERIVKNCIDLGLYVILDWHNLDDHINDYKTEALDFFDYYSEKYANVPNIIYEFANEPYADNSETIANFVKDIREVVLSNTSNPIMLVGQPAPFLNEDGSKNWSIYDRCSALYSALSSLGITDVFVSPHNYGGNHTTSFEKCVTNNIPIFVSEWGNSGSDGDGDYWDQGALSQINYLHTNAIAQSLWKFTDQTMTSSLLKNFGLINSERYRRGFTENELSHNGELLLGKYKDYVTTEWIEREPIS